MFQDLLSHLEIAQYALWTSIPKIAFSYGDGGFGEGGQSLELFKLVVTELMNGSADETVLAHYIRNLMKITNEEEWATYRSILSKEQNITLTDFHSLFPDHSIIRTGYEEDFGYPGFIHTDITKEMIRVHIYVGANGYEVFDEGLVQNLEFEWLEVLDEISKIARDDKLTHMVGYLGNNIIRIIDIDMPGEATRRRLMAERICFDILPPNSKIVPSDAFLVKNEEEMKTYRNGCNFFTPKDSVFGNGTFIDN